MIKNDMDENIPCLEDNKYLVLNVTAKLYVASFDGLCRQKYINCEGDIDMAILKLYANFNRQCYGFIYTLIPKRNLHLLVSKNVNLCEEYSHFKDEKIDGKIIEVPVSVIESTSRDIVEQVLGEPFSGTAEQKEKYLSTIKTIPTSEPNDIINLEIEIENFWEKMDIVSVDMIDIYNGLNTMYDHPDEYIC